MSHPPQSPPVSPLIRPATLADVEAIVDLHGEAFAAKFGAAFGAAFRRQGAAALAMTWQRQGAAALSGMSVAVIDQRIVGTISLRTVHQPAVPEGIAEQVFHQLLGPWRGLRSLFTLSLLDHRIGRHEGYISDVAVAADLRGCGIGRILLDHVEELARQRRLRLISLYVAVSNLPAVRLYDRHGFQRKQRRRSLLTWLFFREYGWWFMTKDLV
jgi:ribosomal protein S18 acetylase RimI-like enzyme